MAVPTPEFYSRDYFYSHSQRGRVSGYPDYTRSSSQADVASYLMWKYFDVSSVLEIGCALGFLVEALRQCGLNAKGVDFSRFAIESCCPGARSHVFWGDVTKGLPFEAGSAELICAFETLEHLAPVDVPRALQEIRRLTRRYVVATIPSFGPNPFGVGGFFGGKVRSELIDHYVSLGYEYDGPIPFEDLARDAAGQPLEGHLTIASFRWWIRNFEAAGIVPCAGVIRRIQPELERFELKEAWNFYAFRLANVPEPPTHLRTPAEVSAVEATLGLRRRLRRSRTRRWSSQLLSPRLTRLVRSIRKGALAWAQRASATAVGTWRRLLR